ncbi:hypothetical protein Cgig2_012366 [Carnegiea gigantea]|uniref:Uncharacterized protein n=1 Tax=Carnegiea gigantea TaxID=171969 RepID=A0A9Q1QKT3_9CARY|nr:hypothetical protein Cgig2_012366 [Carnegiea gigantea]
MGVFINYKEFNRRPENATSSASGHLWNSRASVDPQLPAPRPHRHHHHGWQPHHPEARCPHHRLVLTFGTSLAVVFNVSQVGLKVTFSLKVIGSQGFYEFLEKFCTALMAGMTGLLLDASFSFLNFSERRLYLATDSSDFWRSIWRSPIFPRRRALELSRSWIYVSRVETDGVDLMAFSTSVKAWPTT